LTGLIGALCGAAAVLLSQRWSIRAAAESNRRLEEQKIDDRARQRLVEMLRYVNEWTLVANRWLEAAHESLSDPNATSATQVNIIESTRRLLNGSNARDIMQNLSGAYPEMAKKFDEFNSLAFKILRDAQVAQRMTFLAPGTKARDIRGGTYWTKQQLIVLTDTRRILKSQLISLARSLGDDLLAKPSGYWEDFKKDFSVPLPYRRQQLTE
jgi:hypothetical protein